MQCYRVYLLDNSNRIKSFIEVDARSDMDAITQAARHGRIRCMPVEVWRGADMIYREAA